MTPRGEFHLLCEQSNLVERVPPLFVGPSFKEGSFVVKPSIKAVFLPLRVLIGTISCSFGHFATQTRESWRLILQCTGVQWNTDICIRRI